MSSLSRELVFLILQFLDEEKFKESVHKAFMDGTLSREEFELSCLHMAELWAMRCPNNPKWRWHGIPTIFSTGEGYLELDDWHMQTTVKEPEITKSSTYTHSIDSGVADARDFATVWHSEHNVHFFTYHIVYNDMYKVPKLLLKGRYSDGQPMAWQDILQLVPGGFSNGSSKWTFLTYEEHPYLHIPWLALHPCGTRELMKMVFSTSSFAAHEGGNSKSLPCCTLFYTLVWLSFVSQVICFKLPEGFSQCFESLNCKNLLNQV